MALDVDAPTPGPAGQLGVLPRRDVGVGLAVPLGQLLDHHRARGHVDPQGQGLGREHDAAEPAEEQLLHALLEGRQHARVVRRDAAGEAVEELVVAEHLQVLVGQVRAALLDEREDLVALLRRGQPQVAVQALLDRGVTADPAEDEHDRREQAARSSCSTTSLRRGHPDASGAPRPLVGTLAPARGTPVLDPAARPVVARHPEQLRVDLGLVVLDLGGVATLVGEQVVHAPPDDHVLVERHRSPLLDDRGGLSAHGAEPLAELLGVAHGRRQRGQRHRLGKVDDHLFPHGATHPVGEVVHLVHHHEPQALEGPRPGVQHVAQHLGGHHDHGGLAVDAVVTREQADLLRAVALHQVVELLVRQGLDRRRVERLAPGLQGEVHGELADDGLARPRRRGDQHRAALLELAAGPHLEVVESEGQARGEVGQLGVLAVSTRTLVALGRAHLRGAVRCHVGSLTAPGRAAPAARPPRSAAEVPRAPRRRTP